MTHRFDSPASFTPPADPLKYDAAFEHNVPRDYLAASLARQQFAMLEACHGHLARTTTSRPLIYTGMTALTLCRIELPHCPRLQRKTFHVLYDKRTHRPDRDDTGYLRLPEALRTHRPVTLIHRDREIVCTHPLVTWAMLAAWLSLTEVITLLDAILRADARVANRGEDSRMSLDDISSFLSPLGTFPGRKKCVQSLQFISTVTDSSMECRTLLALLREGLPPPVPQWSTFVPSLGQTVTTDLAYPESNVVIEYDGDAHRQDKRQYRRDARKRQAMQADGLTVIVVFADDILTDRGRALFAQRVAEALGIDPPGVPQPEYEALLDDDRRREARDRQRRYRAKERTKGRRV
ncbi:endonuclease domain-containing protein [Bifidobacterium moraviense]|nr:endonuclease domain-containing protein [Bifidobacterium sp. DSM 109958]